MPRVTKNRTRRLLLWCAATDRSFELAEQHGAPVLSGKCIHCNARHVLALDGTPHTRATLEHIIPRHHGGRDELANLAIACARCNVGKGHRLDARRWDDPTLQRVITTLQTRRAERMRPPLASLDLPPPPADADDD